MTTTARMLIGAADIDAAIAHIAEGCACAVGNPSDVVVAGIAWGGLGFSERLARALSERTGVEVPVGQLNTNFQRDDIGAKPIPPAKGLTAMPVAVDGARVILADDVIASGRTARAALAELFSLGRPAQVWLAVLCDRGHRRLPIQPDFCGFTLETDRSETVVVELNPGAVSLTDRIEVFESDV